MLAGYGKAEAGTATASVPSAAGAVTESLCRLRFQ